MAIMNNMFGNLMAKFAEVFAQMGKKAAINPEIFNELCDTSRRYDLFDHKKLKPTTPLHQLSSFDKGNELDGIEAIMHLESKFGVQLGDKELSKATNVQHLHDLIIKKMQKNKERK